MNPNSEGNGPIHHVFVDFENVPAIDLDAIGGKPIEVILLLGKAQKRLELHLVQQIHQQAAQVRLIEMNASGKNALDLALAFHLGRAVAGCPAADWFHIISRDKDYDPLIAHLRHAGVEIVRHDAFSLPAILAAGKPAVRPAGRPAAAADRVTIVADWLRKGAAHRPKRESTLLSLINAQFQGRLKDGEAAEIVDTLVRRGVISIDPKKKVAYPGF